MSDIRKARKALLSRIFDGAGEASSSDRRAAFDLSALGGPLGALVEKVANQANRINNENIAAAKASGFSEDQILEIVVCAAIGQPNRQYDAALAALAAATGKE